MGHGVGSRATARRRTLRVGSAGRRPPARPARKEQRQGVRAGLGSTRPASSLPRPFRKSGFSLPVRSLPVRVERPPAAVKARWVGGWGLGEGGKGESPPPSSRRPCLAGSRSLCSAVSVCPRPGTRASHHSPESERLCVAQLGEWAPLSVPDGGRRSGCPTRIPLRPNRSMFAGRRVRAALCLDRRRTSGPGDFQPRSESAGPAGAQPHPCPTLHLFKQSLLARKSEGAAAHPSCSPSALAAIATLERFVVYCSSELIISGRAPGHGPEGTGNCSSCYGARRPVRVECSGQSSRSGPRAGVAATSCGT